MRVTSWRLDHHPRRKSRMDRWFSPTMALYRCRGCSACCCRVVDQCASSDDLPTTSTTTTATTSLPSSNNNNNSGEDTVIVGTLRPNLIRELWTSTDMLFQSRLMWLLALGLVALIGDATGTMGEAACFCLSGIALIPCAERLSFVTEQVASRTNGTIGALLNATFGNAPELLISTAALRAGFYRVVQLAMLGSMLTNLLFVFGLSCLVGGIRWQVQELRVPSGGVSVSMLLMATAGSLLPAALELSGQFSQQPRDEDIPTREELQFCRVNAAVMIILYLSYLLFQLGTHKEEFDDDDDHNNENEKDDNPNQGEADDDDDDDDDVAELEQFLPPTTGGARPNLFCLHYFWCCNRNTALASTTTTIASDVEEGPVTLTHRLDPYIPNTYHEPQPHNRRHVGDRKGDTTEVDDAGTIINGTHDSEATLAATTTTSTTIPRTSKRRDGDSKPLTPVKERTQSPHHRRKKNSYEELTPLEDESASDVSVNANIPLSALSKQNKLNRSNRNLLQSNTPSAHLNGDESPDQQRTEKVYLVNADTEVTMSLRAGIVWLFALTLCISALSDILVDTIDGFAQRMHLSEVFTSMVILPFFSNVAEQVSAVLFAYRNEMDLCVGVTVGSAIQIAMFVLPGCVLIGAAVDRSMTLFFHGYETVCLLLGVICVAFVLQGGSTNWLVGMFLLGIYIMIATGIWFHEFENLSTDAEIAIHNSTYGT